MYLSETGGGPAGARVSGVAAGTHPRGSQLLDWRGRMIDIQLTDSGPCIRIVEQDTGRVSREWRGLTASHILTFGVLPARYCRPGRHDCTRRLIWHLILAATAAECAIEKLRLDDRHRSPKRAHPPVNEARRRA